MPTNASQKIINDPVYGFVTIPNGLAFRIIEHPLFQRLRRIKQLGLSFIVYPGAQHTRFNHALGAMYLMGQALHQLQQSGLHISEDECTGAIAAILLHDIGHGPYSHALEQTIIAGVSHEDIGVCLMDVLNKEMGGELDTAIQIFRGEHPKPYLNQLVAGQLDMDRLDYLTRDSYFTGVNEGVISWDRIIKMLHVTDEGKLAVAYKGIYSVEKFLMARRLMYWQVYLHKTVLSADVLLLQLLRRAKMLTESGQTLWGCPNLCHFLQHPPSRAQMEHEPEVLHRFAQLDDADLTSAIKVWSTHSDAVLADLCLRFINRRLPRLELRNQCPTPEEVAHVQQRTIKALGIAPEHADYYVHVGNTSNSAYDPTIEGITMLHKSGQLQDISEASDLFTKEVISKHVVKWWLWAPKEIGHFRA